MGNKLSATVLIFGSAAAGVFLPRTLSSSGGEAWAWTTTIGNCIAGGVMLVVALGHMLPEAVEGLDAKVTVMNGFPTGAVSCIGGALFVIFMESWATASAQSFVEASGDEMDVEMTPSNEHNGRAHGHSHLGTLANSSSSSLFPYTIALMLSWHSLVEGVALGLRSTQSQIVMITFAILGHKFFAGFALGASLVTGNVPDFRSNVMLVMFSCMTPLGVLLGAALLSMDGFLETAVADFIAAISAGTFIYVGLVEVLLPALRDPSLGISKYIATMGGVLLMAVSSSLLHSSDAGHSHGHSHS